MVFGFKGMGLVALVKAGLSFAHGFIGAAFAHEHAFTCEGEIHFFGGVLVPRIVEARGHIDDPCAHVVALKSAACADQAITAKFIKKAGRNIGAFIRLSPMRMRRGGNESIPKRGIARAKEACFGLEEVA